MSDFRPLNVFLICFAVVLIVATVAGFVAHANHESGLTDREKEKTKQMRVEACSHEERIDVRALCIAQVGA